MSLGALTFFGWAATESALPPKAFHSRFLSPYPITLIVVFAVGAVLLVVRKVDDYTKHPEKYEIDVRDETDGSHQIVVLRDNEEPQMVGSTLTAPRNAIISRAFGSDPVRITVPSGGLFGIDPSVTLGIDLPDSVRTFTLPDGGTVSAQLRAVVNEVSDVIGQPTASEPPKEPK
jgi:hypothetical protein